MVDALIPLHAAGMNVFAFDYRGYGLSAFQRPSETHWREDAESAIDYLTNTRHVPAGALVLVGKGLGADLALEVAAAHPELAGIILDEPLSTPTDAIFRDPRAKLVPAHLLVNDRWNPIPPATNLRAPSLWFYRTRVDDQPSDAIHNAYQSIAAPKQQVWVAGSPDAASNFDLALRRWLDDLPKATGTP
jgi:pimeloyl-ACP methyl ester carboxylesterase